MTYRILSLDGGHGDKAGVFLSALERRGEIAGYSVVRNIDLFVGTGSGAVGALLLAWFDDPVRAFEAILRFDDEANEDRTPWSLAGTVLGNNAALATRNIAAFCDEIFGPGATLADIGRSVLVSTVQLDSGSEETGRQWKPRAFTNFPGDVGRVEPIADVVLRSMAMPLQYPIHQSRAGIGPAYVDGAVACNNPAMLAVTAALADRKELEDLRLLSIGAPRNLAGKTHYLEPRLQDGSASWGYRQWMLDPFNPLVLIDLFLQAGAAAATAQCSQLLGGHFLRVEPSAFAGPAWDAPDTDDAVGCTMEWLGRSGWKPAVPAQPAVNRPGFTGGDLV